MTTLYLIRHSIRFSNSDILEFKTTQPPLIQSEKVIAYAHFKLLSICLKHKICLLH